MKKLILSFGILGILWGCVSNSEEPRIAVTYPTTTTVEHVDELWGQEVPDPYRWLEDDRSEETGEWVQAQNDVTYGYLEQIPFREEIKERIAELWDYEKVSAPFKQGERYYFSRNDGLQNQSVMYVKDELEGDAEVFLDPNEFSEDGTVALAGMQFSRDGSLVVINIQESGSDWRKFVVMDVATHEIIGDTLKDIKFSGASWWGTDGFFYSSYDKPEGSELSAMTDQHKLYYHKLGTPQSQDQFIFGGSETPRRYLGSYVSYDNKWLFIRAAESTSNNELYFKNLETDGPIEPIITGFESTHNWVHVENDEMYLQTNLHAPNYRVVKFSLDNPTPENWKDVVPTNEEVVMRSADVAGGKILVNYLKDAHSVIHQYNLDGSLDRIVDLPTVGSAYGFNARNEDEELFYTFTSYTYPPTTFKYTIATGESTLYNSPEVDFNPANYETKQVFYTSQDGTKVPMFITHKKGLELNGNNPTMLYGYGGFNVSLTPSFSTANIWWLEQGGVYAVPNLRGGGEYGENWHQGGTQMNKQNVFDDFIAAAEYLIEEKYTSSEKLAISGGSNGGLLVGATMTQRPELMAVALPAVGVLDMLRYHKFTAGAGWTSDYGNADQSEEMFQYLLGYSPVHNVKEGTAYPATMVTTGDHDDRVVPAHSFKFAAELQANHTGVDPVLIRISTDAGHGGGKPTSKIIEEIADRYTFTYFNMGLEPQPTEKAIQMQ
ncbi:MAG TPA: S9 family peptidase [Cytophagales bacterium]|nr:S9 family peptidase [Cytophagales bacterium]HAA20871.1 S9 family peptidase [Cytophagales bacterium]HAP59160.1 S9 family peptidase [Cytophagales bacterium]